MSSSQYHQDLVLFGDVNLPHVTKNIFQVMDKQTLLNCRRVGQAWKNYVDNPTFWFKKLADDKRQEWKDVENEWKYLAKAAQKIEGMNQYFVLPLMKFFQTGPCQKYETCKALDIVYDLMETEYRVNREYRLRCPILVDFILENVKQNSQIYYGGTDDHDELFEVRAIHLAARYGKVEVVKKLVQKFRDANFPNNKGITPMLLAAAAGELEVVKVLAANTDHPNSKDHEGNTPVHFAAKRGHLEVIKFFMNDLGFHPNSIDGGEAIVDMAAYYGQLDVVKYLVNVDPHNNYDHAIERAKDGEEPEIVDFLKAYTAKK